jgi:hypothetical protein
MVQMFDRMMEIWPGDVVYDSRAGRIIKQHNRYLYSGPENQKGLMIERCFEQAIRLQVIHRNQWCQISANIVVHSVAEAGATLLRAEIQMRYQNIEDYFSDEIGRFCAGREERLARCCKAPFKPGRIHSFLDSFLAESAQNVGFKLVSVTYQNLAAV